MVALRCAISDARRFGNLVPVDQGDAVEVIRKDASGHQSADSCANHNGFCVAHDLLPTFRILFTQAASARPEYAPRTLALGKQTVRKCGSEHRSKALPAKLEGIGHCAILVTDVEAMRGFYQNVLGFELLERDPDHGGVFMNLAGTSHTIDLFPQGTMGMTGTRPSAEASPLAHIAFKVASYQALREAHEVIKENDVKVLALLDHTNQRSIYFADPEGNRLEIYFEKPNWAEIFERGRGDEDRSFSFDEPAPDWDHQPT